MAKMIDKEPKYEGEKIVWHSFSDKLPSDWVVYNTRSINGREYDFCVISPNMGLFIVEVKGWIPNGILNVIDANTILLAGVENPEDSPRGQARGYRFDLRKKIQRELGMNPLVMSFVCYPCISEDEYYAKGLNVVSEANETIFKEELSDSVKLYQKFNERYTIDKGAKHDELDTKSLALIRHHFEPNYDLKEEQQALNPGYSRLRTFKDALSDGDAVEIAEEYFRGIKEIVFVSSGDALQKIVKELETRFIERKIRPDKQDLVIDQWNAEETAIKNSYSIFNCEIEVVSDLSTYVDEDLLIEEGALSEKDEGILRILSEQTDFNYQQYEIEHAPTDGNILITAGAGTGKTYSMVSRIAYLCNKSADAVVDITGEIAMITFTKDAAENMKVRLKKMFMNYFILTSNEKYMHLIEEMNQIQISTIHKFAISLLQKDCMRMGLGYDSQITSETYNRQQLYHQYLNEYLLEKVEENPDFVRQLTMPIYKLEELLLSFCGKLYDRSVDIKDLSISDFGNPPASMPFFNELIERVIMRAELQYALQLKQNNLIGLKECMIQIHNLVDSGKLMRQGNKFKYVFVDEFQDTDDVQIETITGLQKLFGPECRLFIVGDLKQSIYRFRGATLSAFEKVAGTSGIGKWMEYTLNRNYRTDRRLLDRFHLIFLEMGSEQILPYEEMRDRLKSRVRKEYDEGQLICKVNVHSKNKEGMYDDLLNEITNQIRKLEVISRSCKLSADEKKIAVLVRYNWQITNILKAADKAGVTIKVTEGGDLYRLPSTMDLYKLVMAITHPRNKVYLTNLVRSNYVCLDVNLAKISGYTETNKTEELIRLLDEYFMLHMGKTWENIVTDFESRPALIALRDIYEASKPWVWCHSEEERRAYRENYECLIEKITRRYSREYLTINMICEFLKINITTHQEEASRNKVVESDEIQVLCTTIHKSKGLEYGTVILPFTNEDISNIDVGGLNVNVVDGKVSYGFSYDKKTSDYSGGFDQNTEIREKISEESRILYVALTRAIRNVVWLRDVDTDLENCWGRYLEVSDSWQ